jgi:hypothetical protein
MATGTVTFNNFGTAIGTGTLNAAGQATFSTSSLSRGNHAITAVYGGDGNFTGSTSSAYGQTVNKAGSTANLNSSPNPSATGQVVTFTAVVLANSPGAGTPGGVVSFMEGTTVLGTGSLQLVGSSDQATFTTSSLSSGSHTITAVYNGDTNFLGSTSASLTQTETGPRIAPRRTAAAGVSPTSRQDWLHMPF